MARPVSARRRTASVLLAAFALSAAPAGAQVLCSTIHGPDYLVRFDRDSIEFAPRTPDSSEVRDSHSLRLTLTSLGRRESDLAPAATARPERRFGERYVSFVRPDSVERYAPTLDGIELSIVFDRLPPGRGDLVATFDVATELTADAQGTPTQQLHFLGADGDGVRVGAVTGIDADGRTNPGAMRFASGELELVLPAAFVDNATLPLVLDPLIGTISSPSVPTAADLLPDIAYDETNDVYLVVWQRDSPSPTPAVFGQLVNRNGTLRGSPLEIESDGAAPKVGNVNSLDRFVVVYERGNNLYVRTVSAATRAVSAEQQVSAGTSLLDVGDASSLAGDTVPVLHEYRGFCNDGALYGTRVRVLPWGAPQAGNNFLSYGSFYGGPFPRGQLTGFGDASGRYVATWEEHWPNSGLAALTVAVIDLNGTRWNAKSYGVTGANSPDVSGHGTDYTLTYRTSAGVVCQRVQVIGGTLVLQNPVPVAGSREPPSIAKLDGSYLVGVRPSAHNAVSSVDAAVCSPCEGLIPITSGTGTGSVPTIAARTVAGRPQDEALLAWERSDVSGTWVEISAFRADDGLVADLGGGCALGGVARVSCARTGNSGFTHELRDAVPNASAWLLLGATRGAFPCGSCTLVVGTSGPMIAVAVQIDGKGAARVETPLPATASLVGAKLVEQWLVAAGNSCPLLRVALSPGLEVEIQ